MMNEGQVKMVLGENSTRRMSVEERNRLVKELYTQIVSKPTFKVGEIVVATELGLRVKILEPGQIAVVTRCDDKLGEEAGDSRTNVEIQTFAENGSFIRMVVDGRFIKNQKEKKNE